MTQPSNKSTNKLYRNIAIAVIVVVVLIVASFAAVYLSGNSVRIGNPFDFGISTSDSSGTVMQGNSIQTTVSINGISGNYQTVTLSADSGSSGINCNFNPSSSTPDFSSTLTLSVPDSTPTSAYSVTITATGGGATHSTSYTISVLSAKVYVSGTVKTTGLGTKPSEIQFVDQQTGVTYTGSLSGTSYSITLENQDTYTVTVHWTGLLWSSGTYSGGSLYVYAPVGYTSMSQDYSG
jgi:hypothetical protein